MIIEMVDTDRERMKQFLLSPEFVLLVKDIRDEVGKGKYKSHVLFYIFSSIMAFGQKKIPAFVLVTRIKGLVREYPQLLMRFVVMLPAELKMIGIPIPEDLNAFKENEPENGQ